MKTKRQSRKGDVGGEARDSTSRVLQRGPKVFFPWWLLWRAFESLFWDRFGWDWERRHRSELPLPQAPLSLTHRRRGIERSILWWVLDLHCPWKSILFPLFCVWFPWRIYVTVDRRRGGLSCMRLSDRLSWDRVVGRLGRFPLLWSLEWFQNNLLWGECSILKR